MSISKVRGSVCLTKSFLGDRPDQRMGEMWFSSPFRLMLDGCACVLTLIRTSSGGRMGGDGEREEANYIISIFRVCGDF